MLEFCYSVGIREAVDWLFIRVQNSRRKYAIRSAKVMSYSSKVLGMAEVVYTSSAVKIFVDRNMIFNWRANITPLS